MFAMRKFYSIIENRGNTWVTVPRALLAAKGWKKGQKVRWEINNKGELVLKEYEEQ